MYDILNKMESCIICTESTPAGLKKNDLCPCKYFVHNACWIDYVHSTPRVRCLMCRKNVNSNQLSPISQSPNTYYNITSYQQQPYQEFSDIILQRQQPIPNEPSVSITVIPSNRTQNPDHIPFKNKLIAAVFGVSIIVGVIVILILLP